MTPTPQHHGLTGNDTLRQRQQRPPRRRRLPLQARANDGRPQPRTVRRDSLGPRTATAHVKRIAQRRRQPPGTSPPNVDDRRVTRTQATHGTNGNGTDTRHETPPPERNPGHDKRGRPARQRPPHEASAPRPEVPTGQPARASSRRRTQPAGAGAATTTKKAPP